MAKVAITEQYLEDIADAIRSKTGLSNTYLPSEMAEAILTISGGGGIVPSGTKTINISGAGTTTEDVTQYASAQIVVPAGTAGTPTATKSVVSGNKLTVTPGVTNVAGFISGGSIYGTAVQVAASELVSGTLEITTNGTKDVTNYASVEVAVPTGSTINNQDKSVTPTTSQQTITADSGYTGLGTVTVGAMPTMTLPTSAAASATSGFSSKATISRSTSDQYINIPTGYNAAGAYYKVSAVPNGTEGTPTATKGTVSNNSISITPSVTNTAGYITGSTKTGTAVTVSANELVSGTLSITSNGTADVTNYASVNVNVPTGGGTGGITQDANGYIILDDEAGEGGGVAQDTTAYLYFTGSGVDKTSIGINAMNHDVYYEVSYDSSSSYLVEGATTSTQGLKIYDVRLYSDEDLTDLVGYYQVDTGDIAQSARTISNSPWIYLDTEYKIVPHGYYAKFILARSGTDMFSSNANMLSYVLVSGNKITLKAV